jgi:hypothetical protein
LPPYHHLAFFLPINLYRNHTRIFPINEFVRTVYINKLKIIEERN